MRKPILIFGIIAGLLVCVVCYLFVGWARRGGLLEHSTGIVARAADLPFACRALSQLETQGEIRYSYTRRSSLDSTHELFAFSGKTSLPCVKAFCQQYGLDFHEGTDWAEYDWLDRLGSLLVDAFPRSALEVSESDAYVRGTIRELQTDGTTYYNNNIEMTYRRNDGSFFCYIWRTVG